MKKVWERVMAGVLVFALSLVPVSVASADSTDDSDVKGYVSFGADLTDGEKLKTMTGLGLSAVTIADYKQGTVTNQEEHKYLDSYLDSSVIGEKALSSVVVREGAQGSGIVVSTTNINYCTIEMYTNALATAGFTDVDVKVSAPVEVSGTAALVGAMKAYNSMKGEGTIDDTEIDAANNELVLTGQLSESIGQNQATELVALIKNRVVSQGATDDGAIKKIVKAAADEVEVDLTDEQVDQLVALMKKISGLNLDISSVKSQAQSIYNQLTAMDIDPDKARGFWAKIGHFFKKLFSGIF